MLSDLGSKLHITFIALVAAGLLVGLVLDGKKLHDDLMSGVSSGSTASTLTSTPIVDRLAGVTVEADEGTEVAISPTGVLLRPDPESRRAALVCPIHLLRPTTPAEFLESLIGVWAKGLGPMSESVSNGIVHDESTSAVTNLDGSKLNEPMVGELRATRVGPNMRLDAIWSPKEDFDRERAALEALTRTVHFTVPQPLVRQYGTRFAAAVPPGYRFLENPSGVEVFLPNQATPAFGLATGKGTLGSAGADGVIKSYLTHSRGLTNPTSGTTTTYPAFTDSNGQRWEITARELTYRIADVTTRAVLTAAITSGPRGDGFLLAVRHAPPEEWDRDTLLLQAIEQSALVLPEKAGGQPLSLPLTHPDGGSVILEGWGIGQAMTRANRITWRPSLIAYVERASPSTHRHFLMPLCFLQPDGGCFNPENSGEMLQSVVP